MKKLSLLIVDENMSTTEIEINVLQFQSLGIDLSKVTKHDKKRDLNVTITEYIERKKNIKENEGKIF